MFVVLDFINEGKIAFTLIFLIADISAAKDFINPSCDILDDE